MLNPLFGIVCPRLLRPFPGVVPLGSRGDLIKRPLLDNEGVFLIVISFVPAPLMLSALMEIMLF